MAKRDHVQGTLPLRFAALPMNVIRLPACQALPRSAKAFAIDLMYQHCGGNVLFHPSADPCILRGNPSSMHDCQLHHDSEGLCNS